MELARNLRRDSVSRLEPTPPREIDRAARVSDAVAVMRRDNVGCVLVCEAGKLVGLFTERDLMTRVLAVGKPLDLPVSEVMTPDPETVSARDSIRVAIRKMSAGGAGHLAVVDEDRKPLGVLSVKRVVRYLAEHYPATVYNQPPTDRAPETAEGA